MSKGADDERHTDHRTPAVLAGSHSSREAFDGSIADYARSEGLTPKELYSWKGILARRGLLSVPAADEASAGFVRVIAPARPLGMSLVLPNGVRLEWHGESRA